MALLATEKVLTLDYWKPASKIEVGDYVFDRNGKPVKVTLVQQYRSEQCYRVHFGDRMSIGGDVHLGFPVETKHYRKRLREYKGVNKRRALPKPIKVHELLAQPIRLAKDNRFAFSVATTQPIELPTQDLPVPPFIFGFWFLNRKAKGHMVFPKGQEKFITEKFREHGYKIKTGERHPNGEKRFITIPAINSQLHKPNPDRIPNNYLLASAEQKIELLSGLVNAKSRQYKPILDRFRITVRSFPVAMNIVGLVESLGNRVDMEQHWMHEYYTVFFKTRHRLIEGQVSPPVKVTQGRRFIHRIKPIDPQLCVHIETDGEDKSFLAGEGFIACL